VNSNGKWVSSRLAHSNFADFRSGDVHQRFVLLDFLVDERKLVVPHHQRDGEAGHQLGERLAEADALTTEERTEGHRVARLAIRFLEPLRPSVKAFRDPA